MNYEKIEQLIKKENLTQNKAAAAFGMSSPGFKEMLDNKTMKVETLEKIAKYFNVPVSYFFEDGEKLTPSQVPDLPVDIVKEPYTVCRLCNEKDKRIAELELHRDDLRRTICNLELELGTRKKHA